MAYDAKPSTVHADSVMKLPVPTASSGNCFNYYHGKNISPSASIKQPGIVVFLPDQVCIFGLNYQGPHFTIRSISTKATLFSGNIELRTGSQFTSLKPGDQALTAAYGFYRKDSAIVVKKVDTSIVKSWMLPQRKYAEITIQEFVLDMGRLYDFEIVNINCVSKKLVSVYICYNKPIEEILSLFKQMGLRFNYAEKKIRFCPPIYQTKKHLSQMIPTIN